MDNAVHALKIGAAILIFVIAVATTFIAFAQVKQVSETVFIATDNDSYMEYVEGDSSTPNRIVGVDSIIPTLYKYYTEAYSVTILDASGNEIIVFDTANEVLTPEDTIDKLDEFVSKELLGTELKNKKYEETFYEYVYGGAIYTDEITGETIEGINTHTKINITYKVVQ